MGGEIAAEFGQIPPAFLPLGQKRLFEHQVAQLSLWARELVLTIPDQFEVPVSDQEWLDENNVSVLRVPEGLSLGASVQYSLVASEAWGAIVLLHGDTLLPKLRSFPLDAVAVASEQGAYRWDRLENEHQHDVVMAGLFSFSDGRHLVNSLELMQQDFTEAIVSYSDSKILESLPTDTWLDFGHLQNLYRARRLFSSERSFNSVCYTERSVIKSGSDVQKIESEIFWFDNLPSTLRVHTPPFLGRTSGGYETGYEANPNLHDLFVFGQSSWPVWSGISQACFEFLEGCAALPPNGSFETDPLLALTRDKTEVRIRDWLPKQGFSLEKPIILNGSACQSLEKILTETEAIVSSGPRIPGVMHGDFCFTNIFFDFRQRLVRVVDPRGQVRPDQPSIFGDVLYDMAKLNHSISGYDQILAGRFKVRRVRENELAFSLTRHPNRTLVESIFGKRVLAGGISLRHDSVRATTIHLFISMIPLHADRPERQLAYLANALLLYEEWFSS